MPGKALHICNKTGCRRLTTERYCPVHMQEYLKNRDKYRGNAHQRGYNKQWQKARASFLDAHPFCAECLKNGRHTPATVVDHIIPHKGDKRLFWDRNNWQPLCASCHNKKTVLYDGGFGRPAAQGG